MSETEQEIAFAVRRVRHYLANLERVSGLDQEMVHSLHSIPDDEPGMLLASDLRMLTDYASQLAELGASNASLIRRVADLENQLAEAQRQLGQCAAEYKQLVDEWKELPEMRTKLAEANGRAERAEREWQVADHRMVDMLKVVAAAQTWRTWFVAHHADLGKFNPELDFIAALDAYDAAGKGETDEATAGTDRRCCETVNRINDELRRIGILHPLGVAGVRDLAAMASGRLEDLKTLQAQRDKVLALCDEADREQNCPNSGNHNGDIIEDSFICWQCNGTGRLDGAECVETKDLRAVYADSRAGQAGGED